MNINVKLAGQEDAVRWQEFVGGCPAVHPAYDWRWRSIIKDVFKHEPVYFLAEDEQGQVKGVLPLFYVKSLLFGSALVSVPYLNSGGVLTDTNDESIVNKVWLTLMQAVASNVEQDSVISASKYLELRCRESQRENSALDTFEERSHKVAMMLKLPKDPEELFASFPPKLRSQIRRPTKEGCSAFSVSGREATSQHINEFYSVFSQNMRSLGTPVYSRALFAKSLFSFGDKSRLTIVRLRGEPIAAGITIGINSLVEIPWAASLRKYSKIAPNMLLYWEILKQSCLDSFSEFDFGRSGVGAGTYKFKEQWGAKPVPLFWYYKLFSGEIPDISPQNDSFSLAVKVWKKLPMPLTKIIGPYLTRSLP